MKNEKILALLFFIVWCVKPQYQNNILPLIRVIEKLKINVKRNVDNKNVVIKFSVII